MKRRYEIGGSLARLRTAHQGRASPRRDMSSVPFVAKAGRRGEAAGRILGIILLIAMVHAIIRPKATYELAVALMLGIAHALARPLYRETEGSDQLTPMPNEHGEDAPPSAARRAPLPGVQMQEREETIFPRTYVDHAGNVLDGGVHYQIIGKMDMHSVWWSVTLYNEEFNFISNPEGRHSFTSFNMKTGADGRSFVTDIAPERPDGADNWLPSKRGETFNIVWRFYLPGTEILDNPDGFELPEVVCVEE